MIAGSSLFLSCKKDPNFAADQQAIVLKWNQGFADETKEDALLGLKWTLAYIGAANLNDSAVFFQSNQTIKVQVNHLALPSTGAESLRYLQERIKLSEEYRLNGSVDLGRYISLLIGAAEHYYQLVDMPLTLNELLANYSLSPVEGYVNASGVSSKDRIIAYSPSSILNQLLVAREVDPSTGDVLEYETLDLMANGQVRFGIFDAFGNRINAADPSTSSAGKPGKCMWCHESKIQPLFEEQLDFEGYLTGIQLADTLSYFRTKHSSDQLNLNYGIDYSDSQAHQLTELLYISFMEPSAARLANEWGITELEVTNRLASLTTHLQEEFPFLGNLYDRNEVDAYAPFQSIAVSTHVREKSEQEINLFE